jgi:hypothetical protein
VHAASAGDGRQTPEQRLRTDVQRFAGCLDALPGKEGPLLALRAGIGAPHPVSLGDAANRLGISKGHASVLQRRGLRQLRAAGRSGACGSGAAGSHSPAFLAANASSVPQLQPAVLLASQPTLTSPATLAAPSRSDRRGGSGRSGRTAGSASGVGAVSGGRTPGLVHGVESASGTARYLAAVIVLALLTAAMLVAWRRRESAPAPRLADQAGTAAVWWPPTSDLPEAPSAPPGAAVEVLDPLAPSNLAAGPLQLSAGAAPPAALEAGTPAPETEAPAHDVAEPSLTGPRATRPVPPAPRPMGVGAAGSARRHPAAVAAATLVSIGVALLRSRRRRR